MTGPSTLCVLDQDPATEEPLVLRRPERVPGDKLKGFISREKLAFEGSDALGDYLGTDEVPLVAFYYTRRDALLMVFRIPFDADRLGTIAGKHVKAMFPADKAALRLIRCPDRAALETLRRYCGELGK